MNTRPNRFATAVRRLVLFVFLSSAAYADVMSETDIDATVERAMSLFNVPGVTISVVHEGELVYGKGHGILQIDSGDRVNRNTLFQIASVSKAFTAASLALLVDEGRLDWEDKVIDHLPDFRMYDPWVTSEFTIRDLLTHRSGLPLGAGDLLFWPAADTKIEEVIRALRFLKPSSSFRTKYDYDNLMYIVAGQVVAKVTQMPYTDFVEQRIFKPLGMTDCRAGASHVRGRENRATPHLLMDGKLETTGFEESDFIAAAGGIHCSAEGMGQWMKMWLSRGLLPDGQRLLSEKQIDQLWGPVTITPTPGMMKEHAGSHLSAYALGWSVSSFHGEPIYSHAGGLWGMTTFLAFLPRKNLAVFVSNNQMGVTPRAIVYQVLDGFVGGDTDWIEIHHERVTSARSEANDVVAAAAASRQADSTPSLPLEKYIGTYRDDWYGDIYIEQIDGVLYFRSKRSPQLRGPLEHFQFDTFIARWTDRQLMADAYVSFSLTPEGGIDRIAMKAVSPATDFSYDFHDLDLKYVGARSGTN
jgi:CubicO group peptidase (beta-lactamase class C family)